MWTFLRIDIRIRKFYSQIVLVLVTLVSLSTRVRWPRTSGQTKAEQCSRLQPPTNPHSTHCPFSSLLFFHIRLPRSFANNREPNPCYFSTTRLRRCSRVITLPRKPPCCVPSYPNSWHWARSTISTKACVCHVHSQTIVWRSDFSISRYNEN